MIDLKKIISKVLNHKIFRNIDIKKFLIKIFNQLIIFIIKKIII